MTSARTESFQDQMVRKTLEAVQAEVPAMVQGALIQAQNLGFQTVQNVIRGLPPTLVPVDVQDHLINELEQVKVEAPEPAPVIVNAETARPTKQDATVRSWRTFVQSFLGILVVAFGDEILKAFQPDSGFDMYALASWSNLAAAGASAAVAGGIAFLMRYWTPRGT